MSLILLLIWYLILQIVKLVFGPLLKHFDAQVCLLIHQRVQITANLLLLISEKAL
jgi:antibiotic biosynthesis monooxygenase (ABM) superfamily enzyme